MGKILLIGPTVSYGSISRNEMRESFKNYDISAIRLAFGVPPDSAAGVLQPACWILPTTRAINTHTKKPNAAVLAVACVEDRLEPHRRVASLLGLTRRRSWRCQ